MTSSTWNVSSLCRSGSLTAAARELARYKLYLVGVQEVGWDKRTRYEQGIIFFLWKRERKSSIGNRIFFVHHRIVSAFKRVEFVNDRMSYIILRSRWCNIILNVHGPSEEKSDDSKDNLCEELEQVSNFFLRAI
jgi:hypothetical protein